MWDYRNTVRHRQSPRYYQPRDLVQSLSRRLVELLGGDYDINLDEILFRILSEGKSLLICPPLKNDGLHSLGNHTHQSHCCTQLKVPSFDFRGMITYGPRRSLTPSSIAEIPCTKSPLLVVEDVNVRGLVQIRDIGWGMFRRNASG